MNSLIARRLIARREWLSNISRGVLKLGQRSGVTQHHDRAINSAVEVTRSILKYLSILVMHTCAWLQWTCNVGSVVNLWLESCNVGKVTFQEGLGLVLGVFLLLERYGNPVVDLKLVVAG